ncbi:hypothetical protein [Mesorhizobium sp.]|uniref:hypothetical protein n=1 Tax=Mesorhizobium sp. TaxID=1871066 RepID=UPI000FE93CFA|nr:hypothetical protein [Mesorhizobium sp.]RWB06048.1 MAG: hypothetical protein EOQ33_04680 [Mesorhizobium sp.]
MHSGIDISVTPAGDEVDSFIILPPSGHRSEAALREVEAFLNRCFPEYNFFANGDTESFEGDFQILPICGVDGEELGTLRVLDHPDQSVIMGIAAALKGFRPGQPPALN